MYKKKVRETYLIHCLCAATLYCFNMNLSSNLKCNKNPKIVSFIRSALKLERKACTLNHIIH